ncbi:hypothetical protein DB42_CA00080 [Neochlamydia sp. EPS4]|nr:hypothetical protein DB42_CA00080 [Neochlamydia sp. EPS4]
MLLKKMLSLLRALHGGRAVAEVLNYTSLFNNFFALPPAMFIKIPVACSCVS